MIPLTRLRTVATVIAVVGLVGVVLIGVLGAVLRTSPAQSGQRSPSAGPASTERASAPPAVVQVPAGWRSVEGPHGGSYAVPRSWQPRPPAEQVAYRDEGEVAVSGDALAQSWDNDCRADLAPVPVAWALLGAPVHASNPDGVARASAAAWARGYAAMGPGAAVPKPAVRPVRLATGETATAAAVVLDLHGSANPCAGDSAELTVVAVADGAEVRSLVVARYLGVRGSPSDAAYSGMVGSLRP